MTDSLLLDSAKATAKQESGHDHESSNAAKKPSEAALKKALVALGKGTKSLALLNPASPTGALKVPEPGVLFGGEKKPAVNASNGRKGKHLVGRITGYDTTLNAYIVDGRVVVVLAHKPDPGLVGKKLVDPAYPAERQISLRVYEAAGSMKDDAKE